MNTPQTTAKPGLRERKKANTKLTIQQHALHLFHEQGYAATTIEQIAAAAEISPSTFFRYFPSKEDVVLYDDLDPLLFAAIEAQPAELSPIQAMRDAMRIVFTGLSLEEAAQQQERARLILTVPELRMRVMDEFVGMIDRIAEVIAKRIGRRSEEFEMRIFSGAMLGALYAAFFAGLKDPQLDFVSLMDASMSYLEAGLPL